MIKKKFNVGKTIRILVIVIGAAIMVYPLLWMVSSAFKPSNTIFTQTGLIPKEFTLENFKEGWSGWSGYTYTDFFRNSFVMVGLAIIGNVLSCSLAAYSFARCRFKLKKFFFPIVLLTMMIPIQVIIIPRFIIFSKLKWVNSILPIVVPKFFAVDAFFVFLMMQFIQGLPYELDEAARIDGCNHFQVFTKIILPLMIPTVITTVIFTFMWTWNDFFSQSLYLNSTDKFTVTMALRMFLDADESQFGAFYAMSSVSVIPIFVLFIFCQKYLVEGIATSGMKG